MLRSTPMTEEETMEAANYIFQQGKRLESLSFKLLELIVTDKQQYPVSYTHLYVTSTERGKQLSQKYNEETFNMILPCMDAISEEDAECMVRTIEKFYEIMSERRNHFDK